MKNSLNIFLSIILCLGFLSCTEIAPKGEIEVKDSQVADFTQLNLKGRFKVFFVKSAQNLVSVETYPNIFNNLDIESEDGTLTIAEKRTAKNVDFYTITVFGKNELDEITLDERVEMNISGQIKTPELKLMLKGRSKFMGAVNTDKTHIEMAHNANANILGLAKQMDLKLTDSASLVAPYFLIRDLKIHAAQDAFAALQTENRVEGSLSGTSKLIYYGAPFFQLVKKDKAVIEKGKPR